MSDCAGSTNISGTQEWFALSSAPSGSAAHPSAAHPGLYSMGVAAVVLPASLGDAARTYLATVHVVLNIHKLHIKKPAIWPT